MIFSSSRLKMSQQADESVPKSQDWFTRVALERCPDSGYSKCMLN